MEPIQTSLKKWMEQSEGFQKEFQKVKQDLLQDPEIQRLIQEHPSLTGDSLNKHLIKLYEYKSQSKNCEKCTSLNECVNMVQGYVPKPNEDGGPFRLIYEPCSKRKQYEEQVSKKSFVQSLYIPKEIIDASWEGIHLDDPERMPILQEIKQFLMDAEQGVPSKGLYLHGPFGVGKTYLLGAIANELAEYKIQSMIIYMPELVREMKGSLSDGTLNQKIDRFKNVPILMLDDIGAETQSPWFRDEVLGAILQYRMMERLPVFFTSNLSPEELEITLSETSKGGVEKIKAGRIMERIHQVSEPLALYGKNRRKQR